MMDVKTPAILALLFLAAAAAPSVDCRTEADNGQGTAIPLDLAAQSGSSNTGAASGCGNPMPAGSQPSTLHDETGDVLHGLPPPDSLRPIDQPKQAPEFR